MGQTIEQRSIGKMADNLLLTTNGFEINQILRHIGRSDLVDKFGIAFVDTHQGDYSEVWVAKGCVPDNHKTARRLR